jgi:glutamyl-Q tRNA(Asp) synthetase
MTHSSHPILRFAPSPNGYLHLGHAYSALFTAHWAGRLGGTMLLRIEDIDTARSKPEFIQGIFEDLRWLWLDWPEPVMRQSERFPAYAEAADRLRKMGLLYPCFCSRSGIAEASSRTDPDGAPLYPGTCRHLSRDEVEARLTAGETPQWRLHMAKAADLARLLTFTSAQPTPEDRPQICTAEPRRWGDAVIVRKDTPASYHLAVVVDDAAQGVTHVTRGRDLEAATDIHALLQLLLGLPAPIYTFHRLILEEGGDKLAKSKGSETLASLRENGWTPARVRSELGF